MIYLDYNATAPTRAGALDAMEAALATVANPMSLHAPGRRARVCLDHARQEIRELVGAPRANVTFCSGGTEADNIAVMGLAQKRRDATGANRIVLGVVEHAAVSTAAERMEQKGFQVQSIGIEASGALSLTEFEAALGDDVALVCLMLANNETGVIQPVQAVAALAAGYGVPVHCDAVQCAGKMQIDFDTLGVSTMALSAHKLGGPRGVGALVARKDVAMHPLWNGGGHEDGLRAGTQPVLLVIGMAEAARLARTELDELPRVKKERDRFERALSEMVACRIVGQAAPRLDNTSCVVFDGYDAVDLVRKLDAVGIMASGGAACHSGVSIASSVLLAMGIPDELARCAVRFSLGSTTTSATIDTALDRMAQVFSAKEFD